MGPIRGLRKKRAERKAEREDAASAGGDWWDEFSKRISGGSLVISAVSPFVILLRVLLIPLCGHLSLCKEPDMFESVFKISRKTFNYICSLVREDLMARTSNFTFLNGQIMSVDDQVAVALRRLSSGESLLNVGLSFGINQSTVSQVTWHFVEAMEEKGIHHLRWPNSAEEMEKVKSKFDQSWGLPNCCGAIDTTHIMMCLSSADPSCKMWRDYEKNHSMVLLAIVDADMRFRDIVTGWPGSMDDFLILRSSEFFKLCENSGRLNGTSIKLSEESIVREYIIGDEGFPLLPWLITPYRGKDLSGSKAEFNRRHLASRMVAQRALSMLKEMWKYIQGEMWRPDRHRLPRIILVCCILHNIIIDLEDEGRDEMLLSHHHDANYKQQLCDVADDNGSTLRDKLS